jgi:hypothetical protein
MNTALIVEPRDMERIPLILHHFLLTLGPNWKIVFYCGNGLKSKWDLLINKNVEIRELPVNNFTAREYSDFLKSKDLWESLYGTFVLVFQTDTWIMNKAPYTIDYFTSRNRSYIGGNMCYKWVEFEFRTPYPNYNGGLSLRKRKDMIDIINRFPPVKTIANPQYNTKIKDIPSFECLAEDVYFVKGCYQLGLELGDTDEQFNCFCVHTIFYPIAFGVHSPTLIVKNKLIKYYPEIQTAYV